MCVLCVFALARSRAMRMRDKKDMLRVDGDKLTGNCRWFPRTQELLSLCFRSLRRAPRSNPPCHTGRAETVNGQQHRGTGRQSERGSEARGLRVAHASRCPLARVSGGGGSGVAKGHKQTFIYIHIDKHTRLQRARSTRGAKPQRGLAGAMQGAARVLQAHSRRRRHPPCASHGSSAA